MYGFETLVGTKHSYMVGVLDAGCGQNKHLVSMYVECLKKATDSE